MRNLVLVKAAMMLLSLCGLSCSKPITASELHGTWVPVSASRKLLRAGASCSLTLAPNGTFAGSVPDYLVVTPDRASGRPMTGKGRWAYPASDPDYRHYIELVFTDIDGQPANSTRYRLRPEHNGDQLELFLFTWRRAARDLPLNGRRKRT